MDINNHYVPRFIEHYSYVAFDQNSYTLCLDGSRPIKLNINHLTKQLLDQVDGNRNLEEITRAFNATNHVNFSVEDIINVFTKQLIGYGIFSEDHTERIKVKDNYLKLRIQLIPAAWVQKITPFLTFLFGKKVFMVLLSASLSFLLFTLAFNLDIKDIYQDSDPRLLSLLVVVVYVSLLLHELGHAAACDKFGAKSGAIGFGFYAFTPVLYADVTDAWRLKKYQRLIVDFGGIYIQLLICTLLNVVYYFTGMKAFLYTSFVIGLSVAANLNPLLRYDGYWALSDLLNISNLKEKSTKAMRLFLGRMVGINKNWEPSKRSIFLTTYGLLSSGALMLFLVYMLVFNHQSILYFPIHLWSFLATILFDTQEVNFDWFKASVSGLFVPFLFYYMMIRVAVQTMRAKYVQYRNKNKQQAELIPA